ncbi:ABC transporter permease [Brachybacterium sp. YJGR34]|uniref:ABC transporter permease n=1 Tax=Brachybacterium sp. YJGR34 TaxID=2059911 RepID=UPI001E2A2B37|nr:ABC transporter permease [Brachybacterium sp. YJGR34]
MTDLRSGPTGSPLVPPPMERTLDPAAVNRAAEASGLEQIGVRPGLLRYLKDLWTRRSFIQVLAVSKAQAENQNTYLGQVWALLSPLLNALVYVVIFGFILQVGRAGIENTIAFIVVGVFMFRFFERSVMAGAHSINHNLALVRSVKFPRAVLPIAGVLAELASLGPALVVMVLISYLSGFLPIAGRVTIDVYWLLLPAAVALLWIFSTGCAFLVARWVALTPDLDNLLPHIMRVLMYASGVIFSVDRYLGDFSWGWIVEYQPVAVYLYLVRSSILDEPAYPPDLSMWLLGIGWAALFVIAGFLVFWRGEERYGRD